MYVCIYICMYVRMYVCTYVCVYVCIYVCVCIYIYIVYTHIHIHLTECLPLRIKYIPNISISIICTENVIGITPWPKTWATLFPSQNFLGFCVYNFCFWGRTWINMGFYDQSTLVVHSSRNPLNALTTKPNLSSADAVNSQLHNHSKSILIFATVFPWHK